MKPCPNNQRPCVHCDTCNPATTINCKKCGRHPKKNLLKIESLKPENYDKYFIEDVVFLECAKKPHWAVFFWHEGLEGSFEIDESKVEYWGSQIGEAVVIFALRVQKYYDKLDPTIKWR